MALRKGFPAKLSGVGADADDMRYNLAGQVVRSTAGVPRAGLFPPVSSTLLSATATMNISVDKFSGVALRDGGVVFLANDGPTNVLLDAPPSSNSRLDVVYAKQNDASNTVTVPDANNTPIFGVLKGTAAPVPVRNPTGLPAGALELGTVLVPSTAVNTGSSGVVITPTFQYTAMNGGVVDFRTKADLDLWTDAKAGQRAFVIADGAEYVPVGSAWLQGARTQLQLDTTNSVVQTITQIGFGKIVGNGTIEIREDVTFPVAFGGIPSVHVNSIGYRTAGAFNLVGLSDGSPQICGANLITATGFKAVMGQSGSLSASLDWYYTWTATGVPA